MLATLDQMLDDAVDLDGNPIPIESVEARFIIQNYNHVLDSESSPEEEDGDLIENAKKGWSEIARKKALLARRRNMKDDEHTVEASAKFHKEATKGLKTVKGKMEPASKNRAGKHVQADGSPLPKHIPRIPPAWTNVHINTHPDAALLVKGIDAKGRVQSVYSKSHSMKQAALNFVKVAELRNKKEAIAAELAKDMKNPAKREAAIVLALIHHTGIRPGSNSNTKADKQAYGATTLQARHVFDNGTRLKFTGKKGVALSIKITDPNLAKILHARSKSKDRKENLFGVNDNDLREYAKTKDGGGFNPKNFRTAKGTETAIAAMKGVRAPKTQTEYKRKVKEVAIKVSKILGNTPTIALQSYIDPVVFSKWRIE